MIFIFTRQTGFQSSMDRSMDDLTQNSKLRGLFYGIYASEGLPPGQGVRTGGQVS